MNTRVNRISQNRYGYYVEGFYGKRTIYHNSYADLINIANKIRNSLYKLFSRKNTAEPINYRTYFKYTKFFAVLGYSSQLNRVKLDIAYKYVKPSKYSSTDIRKRDHNKYGPQFIGYSFGSILSLREYLNIGYTNNSAAEIHLENILGTYNIMIPILDSLANYKNTLVPYTKDVLLGNLHTLISNTLSYLIHKVEDYQSNIVTEQHTYIVDPSSFYSDIILERIFRILEIYVIIVDLIEIIPSTIRDDKERLKKLKDIVLQLDLHLLDLFLFVNFTTNTVERLKEIEHTDLYKLYQIDQIHPIPSMDNVNISIHLKHCISHRLKDSLFIDQDIPTYIKNLFSTFKT